MASSSIDRSTVDLNRGEMSFGLFDYSQKVDAILKKDAPSLSKLEELAGALGETSFPGYLRGRLETPVGGLEIREIHGI